MTLINPLMKMKNNKTCLLWKNVHSDIVFVDDKIELLSDLFYNELIIMLNEFLNKNHNVSSKLKNLKKLTPS